jgi:hypothetical protein
LIGSHSPPPLVAFSGPSPFHLRSRRTTRGTMKAEATSTQLSELERIRRSLDGE